MSEPQHPQPHDTDRHAGRPAPVAAPAALQPAAQAGNESLASVGARLAQLRESKGWSIEDVSARLKVSVTKLRALEAGDLSHLPDTTFALGVVRSYAKMLGADPAPYTQALRRERGVPAPDLTMPASAGADLPRGKVSLSLGSNAPRRRSWLWGVAAVVVALIALAMWHTNGGDSSAWLARLKATASGAGSTSAASGAAANVAQGSTTAQPADNAEASDAQTAVVAQSASQSEAQQTQPAAAAPNVAANSANPAAATANAAVQASAATGTGAAANSASASTAQAALAGGSTVAIKVTQDSWFSIRQKDGKEVFSGLVHAGDSKEVSGEPPFRVTVGNKAGLDSMTLDGQPVDPAKYASAKGNVARFALP
ncbi:helix-turn-helix domain-containing protein [Paraburkholderia sp. SARCC-3016]|uniref:helix-turn-helix domain-containing protein n=1 Tax=Paraburkholderia sp. SARCC-3016 TaxID=3058611 RepID=UPI00280769C5|nr:helix-turn-helix domain-containing protein [Paraburkholderia sp. SARCC-3016]MDQ7980431.1 helix-turn-helix domain-containing protein [Paraburkholderia sp. SARCC-3016]